MKLEFSRKSFEKSSQTSNFMKILPVEPELAYADERADITRLTVAFRCFANAPKSHSYAWAV